jgi:hypothetical protein
LVASENHAHAVNGAWFPEKTVEMAYEGDRLARVVTYARDGDGKLMTDSLAIARDAQGNRLTDRTFDAEGTLMEIVQYFWRPLGAFLVERHARRPGRSSVVRGQAWSTEKGRWLFDLRGRNLALVPQPPMSR